MPRRAAKVDDNQREVVVALRNIGCSVTLLHAVGEGCPDILVGFRQQNMLMEIKDGKKPPSARKLTAAQQDWHAKWRGKAHVVSSVDHAIDVVMTETSTVQLPIKGEIS